MSQATYVVYPGYVISKTDGDRHYIGFAQLCRLYGVSPAHCINAETLTGYSRKHLPPNAVHLCPRYDGNYQRPS